AADENVFASGSSARPHRAAGRTDTAATTHGRARLRNVWTSVVLVVMSSFSDPLASSPATVEPTEPSTAETPAPREAAPPHAPEARLAAIGFAPRHAPVVESAERAPAAAVRSSRRVELAPRRRTEGRRPPVEPAAADPARASEAETLASEDVAVHERWAPGDE